MEFQNLKFHTKLRLTAQSVNFVTYIYPLKNTDTDTAHTYITTQLRNIHEKNKWYRIS